MPGRVLVGGLNGVSLADGVGDDGPAWSLRRSSLWERYRYGIEGLAVADRPGGGTRVIAVGVDSARPHRRVWVSDDAGETWAERGPLPDIEDGGVPGLGALVALGGSSAVVVLRRGMMYRTDDGGDTWQITGRGPVSDRALYTDSAVLGPDGRLYVGVERGGATFDGAWVYRTTAPLVVASAGAPEPGGFRLTVRPNPARGRAAVTVWLPEGQPVTVALYDVLGRRVGVLHEGPLGPGPSSVALDTSALPAGVYVVRAVGPGAAAEARVTVAE